MPEVIGTDAASSPTFLDAVEHRGEHITIVRRGKVVAQLDPVNSGRGADVKALLRGRSRDPGFRRDIESVRELLEIETRS